MIDLHMIVTLIAKIGVLMEDQGKIQESERQERQVKR